MNAPSARSADVVSGSVVSAAGGQRIFETRRSRSDFVAVAGLPACVGDRLDSARDASEPIHLPPKHSSKMSAVAKITVRSRNPMSIP